MKFFKFSRFAFNFFFSRIMIDIVSRSCQDFFILMNLPVKKADTAGTNTWGAHPDIILSTYLLDTLIHNMNQCFQIVSRDFSSNPVLSGTHLHLQATTVNISIHTRITRPHVNKLPYDFPKNSGITI